MRMKLIANVEVSRRNQSNLRSMLIGYHCKFIELQGTPNGYTLVVKFDGDHEAGLSIMDIIDRFRHQYILANIKENNNRTIPLFKEPA
jgi:hypothetical protein